MNAFIFEELDSAAPEREGFYNCDLCGESSLCDYAGHEIKPFYRVLWTDGVPYTVCVECLDEWMTPEET